MQALETFRADVGTDVSCCAAGSRSLPPAHQFTSERTAPALASSQAVILVTLLRFRAVLSADVALLLLAAGGSAAMLWWRRTHHAAYQRRSAVPRALQRLIVASPACWKVTQQVLAGSLLDIALYALLVLFTSCGVTGNGMVSCDCSSCSSSLDWCSLLRAADLR